MDVRSMVGDGSGSDWRLRFLDGGVILGRSWEGFASEAGVGGRDALLTREGRFLGSVGSVIGSGNGSVSGGGICVETRFSLEPREIENWYR